MMSSPVGDGWCEWQWKEAARRSSWILTKQCFLESGKFVAVTLDSCWHRSKGKDVCGDAAPPSTHTGKNKQNQHQNRAWTAGQHWRDEVPPHTDWDAFPGAGRSVWRRFCLSCLTECQRAAAALQQQLLWMRASWGYWDTDNDFLHWWGHLRREEHPKLAQGQSDSLG